MSTSEAESVYLISLPTGTEGPYAIDELRKHVQAGRLAPTDRVLCGTDKRSRALLEILPEAASLHRSRSHTDSQARAYRTPLPIAPVLGGSPPQPHAAVPLNVYQSRKKILTVIALGVVLAVGALAIGWQLGFLDSFGRGNFGLRWRTTFEGSAKGPWTLVLSGRDLEILSPSRQSTHFRVQQRFLPGGRVQLTINPPHPELGPVIIISSTNPAEVTLEKDKGSAEVLR